MVIGMLNLCSLTNYLTASCNLGESPLGAYSFSRFLHGCLCEGRAYSRGAGILFLVVGHIPVEIFLLVNYFIDALNASNIIF